MNDVILKMMMGCARVWVCALFIASFSCAALTQEADVRISVSLASAPHVVVEGVETVGRRRWSFVDAYGNAVGLSRRVGKFAAFDERGKVAEVKRVGTGEYESPVAYRKFRYEVKLTPPDDEASIAHVSWLTDERGVLMLNDLLPRSVERCVVRIDVPAGWRQVSSERKQGSVFVVEDTDKAVFVVGREVREKSARIGGSEFTFATEGEWAFSDDEAFATVANLYNAHRKIVGGAPQKRVLISLQSFPQSVRAENWRAEVRGGTLNYFTGRQPSRAVALTRLSTAMAHEILHLWAPNGWALDGAYDWFYEGFVEYQAMRVCMQLGIVSYQDYLNAVARVYDKHLASRDGKGMPLLSASERRWTTGGEAVYSDGLLVAFLYDLTLRHESKNRRTMDDVFRELMMRHAQGARREDGNRAVINVLNTMLGSAEFTKRYVESAGVIDLKESVAKFGLQVERVGARARISAAEKLTKEQASLQRKLGYSY